MISSTTNSKIKQVRALQTQRRAREAEHLFVLEGQRLLEEVLRAGVPAQLVLHTGRLNPPGRSVVNRLARAGAIVEEVSEPVMNACSATEHNPGLLAVVAQPQLKPPAAVALALVLDGIAEPGNLGALLRTAEAAGVQAVWLAPGRKFQAAFCRRPFYLRMLVCCTSMPCPPAAGFSAAAVRAIGVMHQHD